MRFKFITLISSLLVAHWLLAQSVPFEQLGLFAPFPTSSTTLADQIQSIEQQLQTAKSDKKELDVETSLAIRADLYALAGTYPLAISILNHQIEKHRDQPYSHGQTLAKLAQLYLQNGDQKNLLRTIHQLNQFTNAANSAGGKRFNQLIWGQYHIQQKDWPTAKKAFAEILVDSSNSLSWNDTTLTAKSYLAWAHLASGQTDTAITLYEQLLANDSVLQVPKRQANILALLGAAHLQQAQFTVAGSLLDSAIHLAQLHASLYTLAFARQQQVWLYEQTNQADQANQSQVQYYQTRLDIKVQQEKALMILLERQPQLGGQADQLSDYEKEIVVITEEQKNLRRNLIYVLAILNFVFMGAVLLYTRQANKLRQEQRLHKSELALNASQLREKQLKEDALKNKLDNRMQDLTNLALTIKRKDSFAVQLNQKLKELQQVHPGEIKSKVNDVIRFANSHLHINQDVELLQQNIDSINEDFYFKLDQQVEGLTQNEKNLCGLIRLKLSNKEIASIRNISVSSAKMSRYRLRKKLSLKPNEDIVKFLQQL